MLLQWEDFAKSNARRLLDRYRDRLCTFNDDIQGTAAVAVAAILSALNVTGTKLPDQRIVIVGAGSAGIGISDQIVAAMMADGLSERDALARLWLVGRYGSLHSATTGLQPIQMHYAQPLERMEGWARDASGNIALAEVVEQVKPTVLIGTTGQPGTFTEQVVRAMVRQVERPAIFPLSNPTSRSEATPSDLIAWTDGRALVATGSPFPEVSHGGRPFRIAQCNNVYIFPGVGLGVIAARARRVSNAMFLAAARALGDASPARDRSQRRAVSSAGRNHPDLAPDRPGYRCTGPARRPRRANRARGTRTPRERRPLGPALPQAAAATLRGITSYAARKPGVGGKAAGDDCRC